MADKLTPRMAEKGQLRESYVKRENCLATIKHLYSGLKGTHLSIQKRQNHEKRTQNGAVAWKI